jgi:hypothetical protein
MSKVTARMPAAKTAPATAPRAVTPAAQRQAEAAPAAPTSAYVVGDFPIQHDGVLYLSGHEIALTDEQATRLGAKVAALPAAVPGQTTTLE